MTSRNPSFFLFGIIFVLSLTTAVDNASSAQISAFATLYEPSGCVQVNTGEVVVVEDEGEKPLYVALPQKGTQQEMLANGKSFSAGGPVDDLEGITSFHDSTFFAITSHSITKKGKRKEKREQLLKLEVNKGSVILGGKTGSLLPSIIEKLNRLPGIDKELAKTPNIEGLSFDKSGKKLLVGLREPTLKGKAIILEIVNPFEVFKNGEFPRFSDQVFLLEVGGNGIRAMEYFPQFDRYLLASEARNKKGKLRSRVWAWDGEVGKSPSRVDLPKLKGTKNIEGISPLRYEHKQYVLIVCDDGDRDNDKGAHYVVIPSAEISF